MSNVTITTNPSMDMFEMMDKGYKFAEIMAKADIIPIHYRMKPANVFIAVQTAYRMNLDPMLVMQNTFVVSGKLGMNTTFAISLANKSGMFDGGIRYREEGSGDDLKITAYAILKKSQEEISYSISMKQAKADGWTKNSKYQTLPELMLRYRAATFLIRTHMPEILNGMHMVEEFEDLTAAMAKNITPVSSPAISKMAALGSKLDNLLTAQEERVKDEADRPHEEAASFKNKNESDEYVRLLNLILQYDVPPETTEKWKVHFEVSDLEELSTEQILKCIKGIEDKFADAKESICEEEVA